MVLALIFIIIFCYGLRVGQADSEHLMMSTHSPTRKSSRSAIRPWFGNNEREFRGSSQGGCARPDAAGIRSENPEGPKRSAKTLFVQYNLFNCCGASAHRDAFGTYPGVGNTEHSPSSQSERGHVAAAERSQIGFDFLYRPVPPGEMEQFADDVAGITHSDKTCWISADNCVGRYIPGDDRSGSDDCTRAYVNA